MGMEKIEERTVELRGRLYGESDMPIEDLNCVTQLTPEKCKKELRLLNETTWAKS